MIRRPVSAASTILAFSVVACGESAAEPGLSTDVVRSTHPELGVPVVTSGSGLAERELGWTVSDEPELVLGVFEGGPEAELFSLVVGAKQRPDGTLFVIDNDADEVRVFDRDGRHITTLGRTGDGPEEFRIPRMVQTPDHFDIRIWDRRHNRMLSIDREIEFGDERTLPNRLGDPLGLIGDTVMTRYDFIYFSREEGPLDQPVRYYAARPGTDTVLVDSLPDPMFVTMGEMNGEPVPSMRSVAFDARPVEAMHFNALLLVPGPAPEIHWYGASGAVTRIVAVDLPPEAPTRDMVVEYGRNTFRARGIEIRDEFLDAYRRMPLVDRIAAFDDLLVDTEGNVWARTYRRDETRPDNRWLVFAPGGELRGYVDIPDFGEIYQIGPDFMLGRVIGELDVNQVVRYGLTR